MLFIITYYLRHQLRARSLAVSARLQLLVHLFYQAAWSETEPEGCASRTMAHPRLARRVRDQVSGKHRRGREPRSGAVC
jgi:hypothetical protein